MDQQPMETAEETIARLRAELDAERREATRKELGIATAAFTREIAVVYEYWRARCRPRVRKLGGERAGAVRGRLQDGYTVQELLRAVDGARFGAYVTPEGLRKDDLELICRNEQKLTLFLDRWYAPMRARLSFGLIAYCLLPGQERPELSVEHGGYRFRCPVCRFGWKYDDERSLRLTAGDGFVYCSGKCVGLEPRAVHDAMLEIFPLVP